jgi:proton-dependent oligopeptide transporter, POT family
MIALAQSLRSLAVVPGSVGVGIGLVCIAVGSGTLKTTTSSVLGDTYAPGDQRRDAGFSIYYIGVNLGALFGPLLTGLVWGWQGFHWGFGLAAIGMAIGPVQYLLLRRSTLGNAGRQIANPLDRPGRIRYAAIAAAAVAAVAVPSVTGVHRRPLSDIVVVLTLVAAVALFAVILSSPRIDTTERRRVLSFHPMFAASAIVWSLWLLLIAARKQISRLMEGVR